MLNLLRKSLPGKPPESPGPDTPNPAKRHGMVMLAFLAWISLGADGLSSINYGPEVGFLALGEHTQLGLYLALATALTVFIIALAYNQVIELFPSGGGGYKVATNLLGKHAGLVSGAALIIDYVLTITISVAAGVDALFSLFPYAMQHYKFISAVALLVMLILLNLRGMKESIAFLLPVVAGFFITHAALIGYGIFAHAEGLPALIPDTLNETTTLAQQTGWIFVASLFLRAYSLGGGTYTGIEAVSNNVNMLAEPRVRTGKLAMLFMAFSLAFTAGGIIVLYLLWDANHVDGLTLNAVTFQAIIGTLEFPEWLSFSTLALVLVLEACLLMIAANTGFLGGPAVMAHMAADSWVPRQFRQLSSRMVTQNGIILMGVAALLIMFWSHGSVALLVVLYSINVFLTFTLSLLGLSVHWWRDRRSIRTWKSKLALSLLGLTVALGILTITLVEKFSEGGWVTVLITGLVVGLCLLVHRHYAETKAKLREVEKLFAKSIKPGASLPKKLNPELPTAVFMVDENRGVGIHTIMWVLRLFPDHFKNFVFLSVGEVDTQSYDSDATIRSMQFKTENTLCYYASFCESQGLEASWQMAYGTDPVQALDELTQKVSEEYPNSVCFAANLIFANDNFLVRWLHNQTALNLQRRLHKRGQQMVILPMKVN
ncbi:MAG TPA: APC family permease [Gallionellaceae bacterium]|nr:APC family permease [Gallionellaceae bacterium]HQS74354.1 APC family permease [Gallionellaceae bacterium]